MKELIIILLLILVIYLSFINTKPKHHKKHHKKHHIPKHAVMPHCWFDKENPCHFNDTNNINTEKYSEFNIQPQPGLIDKSVEGITTSDQYNKIQKIKSDSEQNLKDINSVKGQLKNVDDKISNLNNQITDLRLIRAKQVENLEKLKQYYNS